MTLKAEQIQQLIREWVPLANEIDLRVEKAEHGYAQIRFPFQEKRLRPGGTISGPTMMAAADTAMYAAILASLGQVAMAVTSNLNINFLQRPQPADLIAEARILKLGKRLAYCEVEISCEGAEDLVAHATGSYSIPPDSVK